MLGDVESGLAEWRAIPPEGLQIAYEYTVDTEKYFPRSVIDDPRYQAYLDERGIGRKWTAFLRAKVAELTPITGVAVTDATPQRVVSR